MRKRLLFVFDFDHTIVDLNTDTYIWKLLPKEEKSLPEYFKNEKQWNKFMRKTLQYYYHIGITPNQIRECLQTMQLTPGFLELFDYIKKNEIESAIVSDSNTFFIDSVLEKWSLKGLFNPILTNPAEVIDNQEISLLPFHQHNCQTPSCPKNQCKNIAIKEHFDFSKYDTVCYFGDGNNDYCAGKVLRKNDIIFARKGFKLERMLIEQPLECQQVFWANGQEILEKLQSI